MTEINFFSNNSAAYFRNQAGTGRENQWAIGWNNTSAGPAAMAQSVLPLELSMP